MKVIVTNLLLSTQELKELSDEDVKKLSDMLGTNINAKLNALTHSDTLKTHKTDEESTHCVNALSEIDTSEECVDNALNDDLARTLDNTTKSNSIPNTTTNTDTTTEKENTILIPNNPKGSSLPKESNALTSALPSTKVKPLTHNSLYNEEIDARFMEFWNAYPKCKRKADKARCRTAYQVILKPNMSEHEDIMRGLENWKLDQEWHKLNGQYIPAPLVFLHQRKWEPMQVNPNAPQTKEEMDMTMEFLHTLGETK